ncbi:DNA-processing protein DprA [Undibacterium luofuense]|uniref:DNA-processing protein DprA n=1 Tax=Undibacterium luofuense TaxID=2828733 RepID=UPI0030ED7B76
MHEFASWLRLTETAGVGNGTARRLLQAFGLPEAIFSASLQSLQQVVSPRIAQALLQPVSPALQDLINKTAVWLQRPECHILTLADSRYPPALLNIPDPPVVLYALGDLRFLNQTMIGVVGSRHATNQGTRHAHDFSAALSCAGVTVSSGLAAGIDAAAHEGALTGGGSTVAVVGTGLDKVYPARHKELAHRIAEKGCIISEYPLGTSPVAANFPRRNRLISGLATGVLVVEAAAQSGSLITARMAAEQGRDVFAIPGSIHAPLSKGCHQLIRQGAKLVESAADILEELPQIVTVNSIVSSKVSDRQPDTVEEAWSGLLGYDPVPLDVLAQQAGLEVAAMQAQLLMMELAGQVEMLPGGYVRRLN